LEPVVPFSPDDNDNDNPSELYDTGKYTTMRSEITSGDFKQADEA